MILHDAVARAREGRQSQNWAWFRSNAQRVTVPACIVALAIALSVENPNFLTGSNILGILSGISPIAIVAIGMTFLLISGNFDLSVGGIGAFCAVQGATIMNHTSLWLALVLIVLLGAACGAVNGLLVVRLRINSLVATLGTGYALTGVAAVLAGASPIALKDATLTEAINSSPGGVPASVWVLAGVVIVATWFSHTVAGRALYAVGVNREAARYAGVPVDRVAFIPFVISGALAAVASIVTIGFVNSGLPTVGSDWTLEAIAGAVVGGVSIAGGVGSVAAAMVGMFLIGVVQNGLVLTDIDSNYQDIILGVVLVFAVGTDVSVRERAKRVVRRTSKGDKTPPPTEPAATEGLIATGSKRDP